MQQYQREFINFIIAEKVLTFGEFRLKSGRVSPYFFNAGLFNSGHALSILGHSYAQAIKQTYFRYNVLFGPAYKGIVLAAITCNALYERYSDNVNYAFNRKESKDHGEGGALVGAPLKGRVLIIDDVITAGTAICESLSIINSQSAQAVGVIVALDRQERYDNSSPLSAIQYIEQQFNLPVIPIVTLAHVLEYLETTEEAKTLRQHTKTIRRYQTLYGINPY